MTDPFEPSRKLDAVDPALQAWGEALTDRISAISGHAQINAIEAIDRLRAEVQADRNDRKLVLEYLKRQEAAANELRDGFQSVAETVNGLVSDVDGLKHGQANILARINQNEERMQADEARLDAKRARIEALEAAEQARQAADAARDTEIARLAAENATIAAALAARPSPEEARATYEGVQEIPAIREALARIEEELKRSNGHAD